MQILIILLKFQSNIKSLANIEAHHHRGQLEIMDEDTSSSAGNTSGAAGIQHPTGAL